MGAGAVFLVLVLAWVLVSGRLSARSVTGPIVLGAAGVVAAAAFDVHPALGSESVRQVIEVTLAVVLFRDASSVGLRWFRTSWAYPARLLGIGLPLTVIAGGLVAWLMFPGIDVALAFVVAAALAPTDAALGSSIIEDDRIPLGFRQVVNVESGLNDGLATPIVSVAIAIAAAGALTPGAHPLADALKELALAVALGLAVGLGSGTLVRLAGQRGWALPSLLPIAPAVVAVAVYVIGLEVGANGFVAAFVCGLGFGAVAGKEQRNAVESGPDEELMGFTERLGLLLAFAVWFVFGAAVLEPTLHNVTWAMVGYALLSLTLLRMVPVAIASWRTGLPWDTVLLTGWLGPRGLASIVFAILAFDAIEGADGSFVMTVIALTVAISVLAHGLSAGPLAVWYARRHPVPPSAG